MKNILVTGCAGFIGSNLCNKLLEQGHKVFGIDNFCTGKKENIKGFTVYDLLLGYNQTDEDLYSIFRHINPDEIYHLASPASPPKYEKYWEETIYANVDGTRFLLEECKLAQKFNKKIKFLFSSTSEIYGDPLQHPQKETYYGNSNSFGPRSLYDESKRMGETLCYQYHKHYGVDVKIARIFNTYGPNMELDDGRVITNFITQRLKNQPFTIYGDGTQTRSLCYIDDMADGLIKLMESDINYPINLGHPGEEIDIFRLAMLINELIYGHYKIMYKQDYEYIKLPKDDPKQRCPDITLAKEKLSWEPKVSLKEGLLKTIDWVKTQL